MTIRLPEDLESSVRSEVSNGRFASADEVVAEALRAYLGRRQASGPGPGESAFDVLNRLGLIGRVESGPDSPTDLSTNPIHTVAGLVADVAPSADGIREVIAEIREFRKGRTLGEGVTIRDLIEEGRRS